MNSDLDFNRYSAGDDIHIRGELHKVPNKYCPNCLSSRNLGYSYIEIAISETEFSYLWDAVCSTCKESFREANLLTEEELQFTRAEKLLQLMKELNAEMDKFKQHFKGGS